MKVDSMLLELESYTDNANIVKEMTIERLRLDKLISDEQAEEYSTKWQVIIIKKGWFKRWSEIFAKKSEPDDYQFKLVRFED